MRTLITLLLATIGLSAKATEKEIQMQQQFGPSGFFSVMVPTQWAIEKGENFSANAPNNGPSLSATAYRIESRPPLSEFSNARYQGVINMGIYTQVGQERKLANSEGVIREYEGIWPGDNFVTYYVIGCKSTDDIYACFSLVTTKTDFNVHRVFYEKMLSTFEIHL
jgi:hypothetical protein